MARRWTCTSPGRRCTTATTPMLWRGSGAACVRRAPETSSSRRHRVTPSARSTGTSTRRATTAPCTPPTLTSSLSGSASRRHGASPTSPRPCSPTSGRRSHKTVSPRRDDSSGAGEQRAALQPRYRRAFGCVTWTYMAILAFLAAAFLLLLPFRYVGSGEIYKLLGGLSFFGLVLILPGTALAAALGARTYRSQRRRGTRVGMGIGAIVGWLAFFTLAWLTGLVGPSAASVGPISYAFPPLALAAAGLVLYALFVREASFDRRRNLVLAGAAVALAAGLVVLVADFEPLAVVGVLVSVAAAALAGWVAGVGDSRAGGDDMIPPGAV